MVGPALDVRGGISSVSRELLENGLREHAEIEYISSMVDGSKARKALQAMAALIRFRRLLPDYELVHIHISKGASFYRKEMFAKAAMARGVPFILHEHDGEFRKSFESGDDAYRERVRGLFGSAAKVIVLSEEWYEYFAGNICEESKLVVLHNAVKAPGEDYIKRKYSLDSPERSILFLGRLDAHKGPDVLLRAASRIAGGFPDMRLLFGGDGYQQRYASLARELGIADRCEFMGWVTGEDKESLFAKSAVYCLPSKFEGMPMSVVEAMAHGLPTVSTPVGGTPQVISDGVDGFLVEVGNEEQLARTLSHLLSDADLRERIGRAAYEKIKGKFDISSSIERLVDLYTSVVDARGEV